MRIIYQSVVFMLLFTGCTSTQTANITTFGNVTKNVSDKINEVITEYNNQSVNNELVKLAQHTKPITSEKLEPIGKAIINTSNKKKYALYRANLALGTYASALSSLSKSGNKDDIDLASYKIYSSLVGFNEQYKILQETSKDLIEPKTISTLGSIIAEIGGFYAQEKKLKALKTIVIKADSHVQKICDIMINEFLKGAIEKRLYTIKHNELSGLIKDYNAIVAKASFIKKKQSLEKIYKKYLEMQSSNASVNQAIKAIEEVKKTHATLKKELEKDRFSSKEITQAIGTLKSIENHYDTLQSLMLSCKTQLVLDSKKGGIVCKEQ